MILAIEILGLCIKHFVLAVRLLANVMAGHLVLVVLLSFIVAAGTQMAVIHWGVGIASVLGAAALSMLELFVAFLQAYIFTFLSALFIGAALHEH
jgi:F-type H+-transporting ATPase subunit a